MQAGRLNYSPKRITLPEQDRQFRTPRNHDQHDGKRAASGRADSGTAVPPPGGTGRPGTSPTVIRFIAVAGSIGAGKSSLISFLHSRFRLVPFYEKNDGNPFLEDFYRDMKAFAFPSQIYFLTRKFQAHQEIRRLQRPAILDRTIYEDAEIFAVSLHRRGFMSEREFRTYTVLYRTICLSLPPPDLMIYLRSSVRTQKKRIRLRGRAMEENIDTRYLQTINRLYRKWVERWDRCPVMTIDTDRLDFVADLVHQADVLSELQGHLSGKKKRRKE